MRKQLSSLDLHFLLKELEVLKGSKVDKIYQPEQNLIVFSLYKTNVGKKLLRVNIGQSMFVVEEKEAYETLGFGMLLRKHLDGYFLNEIGQLKPERIVKFTFKIREEIKFLYIEFFGKGNAILCDEHNVIINALEHHEFRERVVKPRLKYVYPIMNYNTFNLNKKQLKELFKNSKKDSIVTCLAVELGLGGIYSEEVCLISDINKNKKPNDMENNEIEIISDTIKKTIHKEIKPQVILQDNNPIDANPFDFEFYKNYSKKKFSTFSEALVFFYSHFKEAKETEFEKKLKELQRIVEEQKTTIEELKNEEQESRAKGELIYHKYNLIKEILDEINKASKKYSWKEIKEKLKGHKIVKEVNEKERKVVVEV